MVFRRREHLLDTSMELILQHGFQATGIRAIVDASGIRKATIYKHYPSKDRLLADALKRHGGLWREWFFSEVQQRAARPADLLPALFSVLEDWLASPEFRGCVFLNALAEFPKKNHPVNRAAHQHKHAVHNRLKTLTQGCPVKSAKAPGLSSVVILLFEGAIATAHATGEAQAAETARTFLKQVI